jgi:DNA-binding ferritin-like protein
MAKTNESSPNNIDQIRQLIFGEQIQDYDRRFNNLVKRMEQLFEALEQKSQETNEKLEQLDKATERKLSELEQSLTKDLENRANKIQQHIKEIQQTISELDNDKTDKNLLADQLIDLAMKLKGQTLLDQLKTDEPDHEQE